VKVCGDRIFVHVNIVLVDGFHDEFVALFLHWSGDKGSQVELWNSIELQLIVYALVSSLPRHGILRYGKPANEKENELKEWLYDIKAFNIRKERDMDDEEGKYIYLGRESLTKREAKLEWRKMSDSEACFGKAIVLLWK